MLSLGLSTAFQSLGSWIPGPSQQQISEAKTLLAMVIPDALPSSIEGKDNRLLEKYAWILNAGKQLNQDQTARLAAIKARHSARKISTPASPPTGTASALLVVEQAQRSQVVPKPKVVRALPLAFTKPLNLIKFLWGSAMISQGLATHTTNHTTCYTPSGTQTILKCLGSGLVIVEDQSHDQGLRIIDLEALTYNQSLRIHAQDLQISFLIEVLENASNRLVTAEDTLKNHTSEIALLNQTSAAPQNYGELGFIITPGSQGSLMPKLRKGTSAENTQDGTFIEYSTIGFSICFVAMICKSITTHYAHKKESTALRLAIAFGSGRDFETGLQAIKTKTGRVNNLLRIKEKILSSTKLSALRTQLINDRHLTDITQNETYQKNPTSCFDRSVARISTPSPINILKEIKEADLGIKRFLDIDLECMPQEYFKKHTQNMTLLTKYNRPGSLENNRLTALENGLITEINKVIQTAQKTLNQHRNTVERRSDYTTLIAFRDINQSHNLGIPETVAINKILNPGDTGPNGLDKTGITDQQLTNIKDALYGCLIAQHNIFLGIEITQAINNEITTIKTAVLAHLNEQLTVDTSSKSMLNLLKTLVKNLMATPSSQSPKDLSAALNLAGIIKESSKSSRATRTAPAQIPATKSKAFSSLTRLKEKQSQPTPTHKPTNATTSTPTKRAAISSAKKSPSHPRGKYACLNPSSAKLIKEAQEVWSENSQSLKMLKEHRDVPGNTIATTETDKAFALLAAAKIPAQITAESLNSLPQNEKTALVVAYEIAKTIQATVDAEIEAIQTAIMAPLYQPLPARTPGYLKRIVNGMTTQDLPRTPVVLSVAAEVTKELIAAGLSTNTEPKTPQKSDPKAHTRPPSLIRCVDPRNLNHELTLVSTEFNSDQGQVTPQQRKEALARTPVVLAEGSRKKTLRRVNQLSPKNTPYIIDIQPGRLPLRERNRKTP